MTTPRPFPSASTPCGNEEVEDFLRRHEPALRRFARRHLGRALRPARDSQELLQSVVTDLIDLLRTGRRLPDGSGLVGFVRVMLRRKVARYWGKAKRLRVQRLAAGPDAGDREIPDPTAVCPAAAAERDDAVRHLLARVADPTDRQILLMIAEQFTAPEIAPAVGLSPVAVRVRLMRLRRELRAETAQITV